MSGLLSTTLRTQLSKRLATAAISKRSIPVLTSLPRLALINNVRTFSNTAINFNAPEKSLKRVINEELKLAQAVPNEIDPAYEEYLETEGYKVVTTPGESRVELVKVDKSTGNLIHVFFDIDEVASLPLNEELQEDMEQDEEDSYDQAFCNVKVVVENQKENTGLILNLLLQSSEETFLVESVTPHNNISAHLRQSAGEADAARAAYQGPNFSELDESLQTEFETYLAEKGINSELADYIITYTEHKEEDEYRNWLSSVGKFLN